MIAGELLSMRFQLQRMRAKNSGSLQLIGIEIPSGVPVATHPDLRITQGSAVCRTLLLALRSGRSRVETIRLSGFVACKDVITE